MSKTDGYTKNNSSPVTSGGTSVPRSRRRIFGDASVLGIVATCVGIVVGVVTVLNILGFVG